MVKRWLAFGCTHAPYTCPKYWASLVDQIKEYDPHVIVQLGDWLDCAAFTHWNDESEHTILDEYEMCNAQMTEIQDAAPKAEWRYHMGNHEERLWKEGRIPRQYRNALKPEKHIPNLAYWKTYPYENGRAGVSNIGNVVFGHAWATAPGGIVDECRRFAPEYGLYVHSHTHRGHPLHMARYGRRPIDRWIVNTGCGIDLDVGLSYMKQHNDDEWSNGFVYGEADTRTTSKPGGWWAEYVEFRNKLGTFTPYPKEIPAA